MLSSAFVSPVPAGETDPSWWRQFNDPVLDAIVGQVLAGSPDVEVATARVSQARAAAGAAGAARLPSHHLTILGYCRELGVPLDGAIVLDLRYL